MTRRRPPAVSGAFYPGDRAALAALVDVLLADAASDAAPDAAGDAAPKALVVPHAGYRYSGPIAATAYARLGGGEAIQRVVVLGPAHTMPLEGLAVSAADAWDTPLGSVPIDDELRARVVELGEVVVDDGPHAREHSIEVQVPFLQRTLGRDFTLLPVVVGRTSPDTTAALLSSVWGGRETLIVVSSDLSHYESHEKACELDRATADSIVALDATSIGSLDACGAHPLRGLITAARDHGLAPALLDLRTSADTAGDRSRVVGYGAFELTSVA